ncbi:hypothetical protein SAI_2373, partial [Streptococcus agalactiae H36B]
RVIVMKNGKVESTSHSKKGVIFGSRGEIRVWD